MKVLIDLSSQILCEALQELLISINEFEVFTPDEFHSGSEPEIVLFDPPKASEDLFERWPQAKFILLDTGLNEKDLTSLALERRIHGIISPDLDKHLFRKALRVVYDGQIWLDQKNLKAILRNAGTLSKRGDLAGLSEKDRRIIELIAKGYKNKEIASELYLSEQTIKAHASRIFKKLNVANRSQLVSLVMQSRPESH